MGLLMITPERIEQIEEYLRWQHPLCYIQAQELSLALREAYAEIDRLRFGEKDMMSEVSQLIHRYREALKWYASDEAWMSNMGDLGERARDALKGT